MPGAAELQLRGFGNLTAARSTDGSAERVRSLSQPHGVDNHWSLMTDSLLGVQANVRIHPTLEGVVQGVARYRYDGAYKPELTWAYVRFRPNPKWTIRAGRLGTELYMLSDSRMVGYSYNTLRPQPDFYATLPFNYVDGLDVAVVQPLAGGLLTTKAFAGHSRELFPLGRDPDFDLNNSLLLGGYLDYFKGFWQMRLGLASVHYAGDLPLEPFYQLLPSASADELRAKDHWTHFASLGVVYTDGALQNEFMLSRNFNDQGTFQDTWAGYVMANYRLGNWTPFAGLSFAKSTPKTLQFPVPGLTDAYQRDFHTDQHSFFAGVRWDFYRNICLKAQVDLVRGSPDSKFLYRWETADWDGSMAVFGLSLDFIF